jgi:hypothetical protein
MVIEMTKADLALAIGILGLFASLHLSPALLLVALVSFLVGRAMP